MIGTQSTHSSITYVGGLPGLVAVLYIWLWLNHRGFLFLHENDMPQDGVREFTA